MSAGGSATADVRDQETCPRCGTFATLRRRGDRRLRESCLERTIHPMAAAPATLGAILSGVLELFPEANADANLQPRGGT